MELVQISLNLPSDLKKEIDSYAKKIGIPATAIIKIAIKEYLNKGE